jgi:glucan phosphorylase
MPNSRAKALTLTTTQQFNVINLVSLANNQMPNWVNIFFHMTQMKVSAKQKNHNISPASKVWEEALEVWEETVVVWQNIKTNSISPIKTLSPQNSRLGNLITKTLQPYSPHRKTSMSLLKTLLCQYNLQNYSKKIRDLKKKNSPNPSEI